MLVERETLCLVVAEVLTTMVVPETDLTLPDTECRLKVLVGRCRAIRRPGRAKPGLGPWHVVEAGEIRTEDAASTPPEPRVPVATTQSPGAMSL